MNPEGLASDANAALDPSCTHQLRSYLDESESLSDLTDLDDDDMAVDDEGTTFHKETEPVARRKEGGGSSSKNTR